MKNIFICVSKFMYGGVSVCICGHTQPHIPQFLGVLVNTAQKCAVNTDRINLCSRKCKPSNTAELLPGEDFK